MRNLCLPILLFCYLVETTQAQPLHYNFRTVSSAQGLSMSSVVTICEDKYGYIWIGTQNAMNRYDGYSIKIFENRRGDPCTVLPGGGRHIFCDSQGRLWFGLLNGLSEYNYETECYRTIGDKVFTWIQEIMEVEPNRLFIAWNGGLSEVDTRTDSIIHHDAKGKFRIPAIYDIAKLGRVLLLSGETGILTYNLDTEIFTQVKLPDFLVGKKIARIATNGSDKVWCSVLGEDGNVYRTNPRFDTWKIYPDLRVTPAGQVNAINQLFVDRQSRLWVPSGYSGIALYDSLTDHFRNVRLEPWMPNGIPSVYVRHLYQDREGNIWGASRLGAFFFDPDQALFETLIPGNSSTKDENLYSARSCLETADGKLWLGTGTGLFRMDPVTGDTKHYFNQKGRPPVLHDNSVRALHMDRSGTLWIATAKGVNILRAGSSRIEFLDERDGLPKVVTKAIHEAKDGTIWVANFSESGHCYRLPGERKFHSLREHPALGKVAGPYGQCILEDSRGKLWFGLDGLGITYFDPVSQEVRRWRRTPDNDSTLLGNFVYSLTEDHSGRIWAATSEGISVIDPRTYTFTNFDRSSGLPTNRFLVIRCDDQDRLWVGTARGLLLLDNNGQLIKQFDSNDGLVENEFSDRPSAVLKDGRFVFPTIQGFLLFSPRQYTGLQQQLPLMISQVRVFNKLFNTGANIENLHSLYLPPGNNFFSLDILGFNFSNPHQTWYAYKMEPYDKEWTYTQDRTADYTNVPAGTYKFRFKATTDANQWNVPEKTLTIEVGEHWYLSQWFWSLIAFLLLALIFYALRRRTRMREAFLVLEQKAQALSKEKALVQYENLTQQLNPHFLFNSLASLGSLIRFNPKTASEFLEALSKMYRYILQNRDRETVPVREEKAFVAYFIKLQKTRFEDAFQVDIRIPADIEDKKIVPVMLQNLLENALKHNIFDQESPLRVEIFQEGGYLVVRNNLQKRTVVETSNNQGLARLKTLYQYLTDRPLLVEETPTHFTVKVPLF